MADVRWTAETEELVARACGDPGSVCARMPGESTSQWSAHAVLSLLDAHGVLIPVGGETRQEWCVQSGRVDYPCSDEVRARHQQGRLFMLGHPATRQTRTVTTYPDDTVITSPWREVADGD